MRVLYLSPYDTGSHAGFTRALTEHIEADWTVLTLPGRHWKWRARGSALYFAREHAEALRQPHDLIVATSVLPLQDLIALHPALAQRPTLLYFHENQLAYPVQADHARERDFHFGFSQLLSSLSATRCAFNSRWNRDSFLSEGRKLLRRMPDATSADWMDAIAERSVVLPVPIDYPEIDAEDCTAAEISTEERASGPIILWNHRWEYDKDPETFFEALFALQQRQVPFRLALCGKRFRRSPPIFERAREQLADHIVHWGYAASRDQYLDLLKSAHIAVSTAIHEFFGVAMLEATHCGAYPLVPARLSYPELFPEAHQYDTTDALIERLALLCQGWRRGNLALRADRRAISRPYGLSSLKLYQNLFEDMVS